MIEVRHAHRKHCCPDETAIGRHPTSRVSQCEQPPLRTEEENPPDTLRPNGITDRDSQKKNISELIMHFVADTDTDEELFWTNSS